MTDIGVSVVQPGEGDTVAIPGFGAVFKLSGKNNNGEVSIVEHPFAVGFISAAHRHTREDEHSIVLAAQPALALSHLLHPAERAIWSR